MAEKTTTKRFFEKPVLSARFSPEELDFMEECLPDIMEGKEDFSIREFIFSAVEKAATRAKPKKENTEKINQLQAEIEKLTSELIKQKEQTLLRSSTFQRTSSSLTYNT